jgi:hypothetical protein
MRAQQQAAGAGSTKLLLVAPLSSLYRHVSSVRCVSRRQAAP